MEKHVSALVKSCVVWVLIAAWNFPSEVILLEHELLTIAEDKQEHAQSELKKCIKVTCTDTCSLSSAIVNNSCSNKITSLGKFHAAIKTQSARKDIR
jgi:hypothetical protein